MSKAFDQQGAPVLVGCELVSIRNPDSIRLRCIGITDEWVFVIQKFKNAAPWGLSVSDFPHTQYIVTQQPDEE